MKKILIITSSVDYTVDYIITKYSNECKFYRVNVDKFDNYKFNISYDEGFCIINSQWRIGEDDIDAIYYRKPILPDLSKYEICYHKMISQDIISYINGIVDGFEKKVLTKPIILRQSENKVYQAKIAKKVGFEFANSSIGTSVDNINDVISSGGIIKPLTTGKIVNGQKCELIQTSRIDTYIEEDISLTPIYVQEYVEKYYELRITIVDDKIYPVRIDAYNIVDWRVNQEYNKYSLVDIPKNIENKCLEMLKILNLKFGAFDFIVNKKEEFIFLEVNPNGQWLWLEEILDLNISQEIVRYLQGE
ncbi:TPA: hypothetical protein ACG3I2_003430 [Clostridioides difficile]